MIEFLSSVVPGGKLAQESKEAIDYWKEYKDERIRIERVSFSPQYATTSEAKRVRHGVEGTVEKVMTLPPGFVLKDTKEVRDAEIEDMGEPTPTLPQDEHDRLFVAFQSVERIVFVDE